jgi:YggT family protein
MDPFCASCFVLIFARTFVEALGWALTVLIFARVILSWVQLPLPAGLSRWVFDVTEPILGPIRRVLPATMGLDFSPFIAIVLIQLVQSVLLRLIASALF